MMNRFLTGLNGALTTVLAMLSITVGVFVVAWVVSVGLIKVVLSVVAPSRPLPRPHPLPVARSIHRVKRRP